MPLRSHSELATHLGERHLDGPSADEQRQNGALVHFDGVNDGRMFVLFFGPDHTNAAQAQCDHRHHIPKTSFKVQNWPEYEAGLRRRGSLTLWIEDAVLGDWQNTGPAGQARYTDAAIQTRLMLRMTFKLALRQTEGLMMSVLTLMGLLSAPDHSTVGRWCYH